jgi:hypothetical protein
MNFFQFDEQSNLTTANNIWIFFVLTVPITLVVVVLGNIYMNLMASPDRPFDSTSLPKKRFPPEPSLPSGTLNEADFKLPSLKEELAAGPFHTRPPQPISGLDFRGTYLTHG